MPNIVLGVCGSVAAYRAADLARDLMRAGFTVRACLTDNAEQFVTRSLFEALTGQPCLQDTFEEPQRGRMAHIEWARDATALLIAPASANTLNKLANGLGDDMLTTLALAYRGPLVMAPAMNPSMYAHQATLDSIQKLRERAAVFVEPDEGDVACGEYGQGKLAGKRRIVEAVLEVARVSRLWEGKRVVITSGPTQEPIDDVRFLSNRSSGKMGAALARAALLMGADVTVISGPTSEPMPLGAQVKRVRTAEEMLKAALAATKTADLVIGAAAVADYRPAQIIEGKMRRSADRHQLDLIRNPDIIAEVARSTSAKCIGFAAEPYPDTETAEMKMASKGLDGIAANDISRSDVGFEANDNELTLLRKDKEPVSSGKMSKLRCALWLLEKLAE